MPDINYKLLLVRKKKRKKERVELKQYREFQKGEETTTFKAQEWSQGDLGLNWVTGSYV